MTNQVYNPPPTIERFLASNKRVRLIRGPLGSGKTTGCVMEIARRAAEQAPGPDKVRRSRWLIVRNTGDQLKDTTMKSWFSWFPKGVAGHYAVVERTFYLKFADVEAEILFRPLDTEEDQQRVLSLDLTGAYVNELRELPFRLVLAILGRCGRYPAKKDGGPTWYGLVADTNSPDFDHWIPAVFGDVAEEIPEEDRKAMEAAGVKITDWEMFVQPGGLDAGAENRENLPPTYYEDLLLGAVNDPDWVRIHVHNRYGPSKLGKPVYDGAWDRAIHVSLTPLEPLRSANYPIVIGFDFGRQPAAVFKQRDWRGRTLTLDECIGENIALDTLMQKQVVPLMRSPRYSGCAFVAVGDPAGWAQGQYYEGNAADVFKKYGLVHNRPAPTNDPVKRIDAVEKELRMRLNNEPVYLVDPTRCKKLIQGFDGRYIYRKQKTGATETTPFKNAWSHVHDANQYGDLGIQLGLTGALMETVREVEGMSMEGFL